MPSHTTVEIYSNILNIANKLGITPIRQELVTPSKSASNNQNNGRSSSDHDSKTEKCCSSFTIENHIDTTSRNLCKTSAFPILKFENARNKSPMFWIMLIFFFGTALSSIYKLIVTIQATQVSKMTGGEIKSKMDIGIPLLVASLVWVIYSLTCCAAYFVHILKAEQVCRFLHKWQIAEGQLITG